MSRHGFPSGASSRLLRFAIVVLSLLGCDRGAFEKEGRTRRAEVTSSPDSVTPSLAEQILAVKAGDTNEIRLAEISLTEDDLSQIAELPTLRSLIIGGDGKELSVPSLTILSEMTDLETLALGKTPLTDSGASHLLRLVSLRDLRLPHSHITDEMLGKLSRLPELERVVFGSDKLTDRGLEHFLSMPKLRHLLLYPSPVSNAGLAKLAGLKHVESLYLVGVPISSETLSQLERSVEHVHVP